jgi:hypothetical protein
VHLNVNIHETIPDASELTKVTMITPPLRPFHLSSGAHTRSGCVPVLNPGEEAYISSLATLSPSLYAGCSGERPLIMDVLLHSTYPGPDETSNFEIQSKMICNCYNSSDSNERSAFFHGASC